MSDLRGRCPHSSRRCCCGSLDCHTNGQPCIVTCARGITFSLYCASRLWRKSLSFTSSNSSMRTISGAMYSRVPTRLTGTSERVSIASPKSQSLLVPSARKCLIKYVLVSRKRRCARRRAAHANHEGRKRAHTSHHYDVFGFHVAVDHPVGVQERNRLANGHHDLAYNKSLWELPAVEAPSHLKEIPPHCMFL